MDCSVTTTLSWLIRRSQTRPGPESLRRPRLARLAPPRHPRHGRTGLTHSAALRLKSPHGSLSLHEVLGALQDLLRCWDGTCTTFGRPLSASRTST